MPDVSSSKLFRFLDDSAAVYLLAFVGGFVDAAGYMKLDELFTSSITGNIVVACLSIFHSYGVLCRALVTIFFAVGGALGVAISEIMQRKSYDKRTIAASLFTASSVVIFLTFAVGQSYAEQFHQFNLESYEVGHLYGYSHCICCMLFR
jgi:uncharacterized membrane protein YoaK (UPF0700 family)